MLSRRNLLTGPAAVALSPSLSEQAGKWVVYHPSLDRAVSLACSAIQDVMRQKLRADVVSGRVRFPASVTRELGFSGHKARDAGGQG